MTIGREPPDGHEQDVRPGIPAVVDDIDDRYVAVAGDGSADDLGKARHAGRRLTHQG